jgi:hypothetical protein
MADAEEAPEWNPKLYVVTRKDLIPGAQACQAIHAVCEFADKHPPAYRRWYKKSNYLALLSVNDERALNKYVRRARVNKIHYAEFREPDLDNALTAVVFDATEDAREMLKNERSALKTNFYGAVRK